MPDIRHQGPGVVFIIYIIFLMSAKLPAAVWFTLVGLITILYLQNNNLIIPNVFNVVSANLCTTISNEFGTKVHIVEMMDRILPNEDHEVSEEVEKNFKKSGIRKSH